MTNIKKIITADEHTFIYDGKVKQAKFSNKIFTDYLK